MSLPSKPSPDFLTGRFIGVLSAACLLSWTALARAPHLPGPVSAFVKAFVSVFEIAGILTGFALVLLLPIYILRVVTGEDRGPVLLGDLARKFFRSGVWRGGAGPFLLLPFTALMTGAPPIPAVLLAAAGVAARAILLRLAHGAVDAAAEVPPGAALVVKTARALRPAAVVAPVPPWLMRARLKAAGIVLNPPWGLVVTAAFYAVGNTLKPTLGQSAAGAVFLAAFVSSIAWGLYLPAFMAGRGAVGIRATRLGEDRGRRPPL